MSNRKLAILGIVAAGMIAWAAVQSGISKRSAGGSVAGTYLVQGLDPSAIGIIAVQADGNTVTLARQDKNFVVIEKNNYPAQTSTINNLITSCLDIQTADIITSEKANFTELGVSDDKPEKAVKFLKPDKSVIAGILIGKNAKDTPGTYVRLLGGDKVYLSTNVPWVQTTAMDYIDRNLTDVKREDIAELSVTSPDGSFTITNEPNRGVRLENVPTGKKEKRSDTDQVFISLTNCPFDDVIKDASGLNFDRTYVWHLKDSTVYTFNVAPKGDKTFVKCTADFGDKSEVLKKNTVESEEALKAKEAKLLARDKAEAFAKKTQGWIYEIPEWKAKNLKINFADLIENEPNKPADANNTKPKPANTDSTEQQ
jgi:hypothetical protein